MSIEYKIGDKVTYIPRHARNNESHPDREIGRVTSVNDSFVFVDHKACRRDDIKLGDHTFYCHDEHNSVLDGAFGRCSSICDNCFRSRNLIKQS